MGAHRQTVVLAYPRISCRHGRRRHAAGRSSNATHRKAGARFEGGSEMNVQLSRRWLPANVVGVVAGMLLFAVIADSGWAEEPELLDVAAHLAGMLAFGTVLGFLQRRAIGALRTSLPVWAGVLGLVQFLSLGLTFEF